jgi:integrase
MRKIVHRRASAARATRPTPLSSQRKISDQWTLYDPTGLRKYLNDDERRRFIAAAMQAEPEVRTLCLTLAYIGCRISEALNLRAADIEVASGLIAVRSLKKRGRLVVRQVPAPPALLDDLTSVHQLASLELNETDTRLWSWGRTRAWQLVKAVMVRARIEKLPASPKGLRHGFGVHAVLSGVPLNLIQKWLGHEDIATTAIYTNLLGPEEQEVAARMWAEDISKPSVQCNASEVGS